MAGESSSQEMETASFSKMLNGITPQKTNVWIFDKLRPNEFTVCFVYGTGHFTGSGL
jgi:hypothetical protein